jgi:hypothetical protein
MRKKKKKKKSKKETTKTNQNNSYSNKGKRKRGLKKSRDSKSRIIKASNKKALFSTIRRRSIALTKGNLSSVSSLFL